DNRLIQPPQSGGPCSSRPPSVRALLGRTPTVYSARREADLVMTSIGIAREDPTAMSPRTESIGAEPAPQSRPADLCYQALGDYFAPNLRKRKSRQWQLQAMGKFTSQSLNLDDDAGGKTGRVARPEAEPRGREVARGQIVCAIC